MPILHFCKLPRALPGMCGHGLPALAKHRQHALVEIPAVERVELLDQIVVNHDRSGDFFGQEPQNRVDHPLVALGWHEAPVQRENI